MDYANGKWHKQCKGWNEKFEKDFKVKISNSNSIKYSQHLENEVKNGHFSKDFELNKISIELLTDAELFEVEIKGNEVKFACRTKYNKDLDISVVIMPRNSCLFIKTAWINNRKDTHKTLDCSLYGFAKELEERSEAKDKHKKQIAPLGANIGSMIPPEVLNMLKNLRDA